MRREREKRSSRRDDARRLVQRLAVTGIMLAAGSAYAGNVDTFGIGSRATALGGAYAATADDPFAAYYNPAGLTQIKSATITAGAHLLAPSMQANDLGATAAAGGTAPAGSTLIPPTNVDDRSDVMAVPHLGFAMPINNRLAVGLAAYVPWGLDIKWSSSDPAAYSSSHSWYNRIVLTPTVAYKITDQLSVGAGISLGRSESGDEHYLFAGSPTGPAGQFQNWKIKTQLVDDLNWSYNLGVMYKPFTPLTLLVTYRSRTETNFKGTTEVSGFPVAGSPINQKVNTSVSVDHPQQVQVGVRYQPIKTVSMELDYVWTNWSIIDSYTAHFSAPLVVLGGATSKTYARNWNDTNQIRIGVEWQALEWLALRGGYFYDPSPVPDTTFDLTWPDADKKTYSLGAGFKMGKHLTLDTVVQYTYAEQKRQIGGESVNLNAMTGAAPSQASVNANGQLWGGGLTFTYTF